MAIARGLYALGGVLLAPAGVAALLRGGCFWLLALGVNCSGGFFFSLMARLEAHQPDCLPQCFKRYLLLKVYSLYLY